METIAHFSHQHLLTICEIREHEEVNCAACEKRCSNQSYSCKKCQFFLDKSCAELPRELKYALHLHKLTLRDTANYGSIYCDACVKRFRGFTFRCEMCDFDLDIECALKSTNGSKVKQLIEHFSHGDPLILLELIPEGEEVWCKACERRCLNNTYSCGSCQFFLHKTCAELQQELHHPIHSHTLKLRATVPDDRGLWCDFCGKIFHGFFYHCNGCQFYLDVICAQQLPPSEPGGLKQIDQITNFGHRHPLTPSTRDYEDENVRCRACHESCLGPVYCCERCEYFLHESCANLPLELKHIYHEQHPLKLQITTYRYCDFCEERIWGYTYRCNQCNVDLDIFCAQMPSIRPGEGRVTEMKTKFQDIKKTHFLHDHELTGSMKRKKDRVPCSRCEELCTGPTFACEDCKFYLHEACYEFPPEYKHFFHPRHELTLQKSDLGVNCRACEKMCRGFVFSCGKCKFRMDFGCAMMAKKVNGGGYLPHLVVDIP